MVLSNAQLHGHLEEGAHHEDVRVVGRGHKQRCVEVLVDLLDAPQQAAEEVLIGEKL